VEANDPDAGGFFDDAGGDFEETHAHCGELDGGERGFFRIACCMRHISH